MSEAGERVILLYVTQRHGPDESQQGLVESASEDAEGCVCARVRMQMEGAAW